MKWFTGFRPTLKMFEMNFLHHFQWGKWGKFTGPKRKLKGNYNWCNGGLLQCILIVSSNYRKRKLNVVANGGGEGGVARMPDLLQFM